MIDFAGSLIVWLRPLIPEASIAGRVPIAMPTKFILVRRIGGGRLFPARDQPTIQIDAWAETETAAHDLCQKARRLLWSLQGGTLNGVAVYRIEEFAGPGHLPDPDREGQERFRFTASVHHREEMSA